MFLYTCGYSVCLLVCVVGVRIVVCSFHWYICSGFNVLITDVPLVD